MIGLDTNILLRVFTNDDPVQSASARGFVEASAGEKPLFVCLIVLVEFAWSLRRTYDYTPDMVRDAVGRLLDASDIVLEQRDLVEGCLAASRGRTDLADLLIGHGNRAQGCSVTVTFDKQVARTVSGMELLA